MSGTRLTAEDIARIDSEGMLDRILNLPQQIEHAITISQATPLKLATDFANVCFAGMGGSAIGGDVVRAALSDVSRVPIAVSRYYSLPKYINEKSLVVACSYSGDTEETLAAYDDALAKRASVVCVTSGGSLAEKARANGHPMILVPGGFPPRSALGYLTSPLLFILHYADLISSPLSELRETISVLRSLSEEYHPRSEPNLAKKIACELHGKIPLIYTSAVGVEPAALRWKCQLAENSEVMAGCHVFPELNHNEIMGWGPLREINHTFRAVYLRDREMHPRVLKRMAVTKDIISQHADGIIEVESKGDSLLARIFSLIFLGDMVSLYLAILNGVDPTAIGNINFVKKSLSS